MTHTQDSVLSTDRRADVKPQRSQAIILGLSHCLFLADVSRNSLQGEVRTL